MNVHWVFAFHLKPRNSVILEETFAVSGFVKNAGKQRILSMQNFQERKMQKKMKLVKRAILGLDQRKEHVADFEIETG
jgi:hypothetical protein